MALLSIRHDGFKCLNVRGLHCRMWNQAMKGQSGESTIVPPTLHDASRRRMVGPNPKLKPTRESRGLHLKSGYGGWRNGAPDLDPSGRKWRLAIGALKLVSGGWRSGRPSPTCQFVKWWLANGAPYQKRLWRLVVGARAVHKAPAITHSSF